MIIVIISEKGGDKMYLETVKQITAVENEMEQAKAAARAQVQQQLAEAERAGKELLQRTQAQNRAARDEALAQAQQQAAQQQQQSQALAQTECDRLRESAALKMALAAEEIVRRVVEG